MSKQGHLLKPLILSSLLSFLVVASGCDEETDRFEHLKKLRALGVSTQPVIAAPSTAEAPAVALLTFRAAVPLGETVTAEEFVDDRAKSGLPLPATIVPGSETYEDHNKLRLYTVQATVPIPTADQIAISPETGFARVRYALRLTSGAEEEKVVGNVLIYPEGSPELAWTPPEADIAEPAGANVSGDQELKATLTNNIGENMRVGWFVSDGKIENRRAKETEWETPDAGPHTIVLTVRGLKSGAFAMKVLDVTVE